MSYEEFLAAKVKRAPSTGADVSVVHPMLHDWQAEIVRWAAKVGRAAIWADTGLGKTIMQVEWLRHMAADGYGLIIAPLAVCHQTVREAAKIGVDATYVRTSAQLNGPGVYVTNYEMVEHFDPLDLRAVVLDEASILKQSAGKTRTMLIRHFEPVPYRLACTATPAPNDPEELTNQAEFLGHMSRSHMLAAYFIHDDHGWRLKGHARRPMMQWMATWAVALRKPSDLGYNDDGYDLPGLEVVPHLIDVPINAEGQLFPTDLGGVGGRAKVRRETLDARCRRAAELVRTEPDEPWLIWCGLNDEAELLASLTGGFNITGAMSPEDKADALLGFADGKHQIVVTKPSVASLGLNWQHCARMAFVGLSDSYEQYYQAIRRCYRYGQTRIVHAHVILSDLEGQIAVNIARKERSASAVTAALVDEMRRVRTEAPRMKLSECDDYVTADAEGENWHLMLGDSCERLAELPDESVDLSIYSPPFASLFTYSPSQRDLGNSATREEFIEHYGYIIRENLRLTKPGRIACIHVQQLTTTKSTHGYMGLTDFRGDVIRAYMDAGWIFHGEVTVNKDPQAQAIRTKAHALMFVTKNRDSSMTRPALADYLLMFRKPGDNAIPIKNDVSNEEWIEWAQPVWWDIRETNTLNERVAREEADERHICPLQLDFIERCVRLWSNPGEVVLSPFAGIGSEVYVARKLGRYGLGYELKPSYWRTAVDNLRRLEAEMSHATLFDEALT